MDAWIKAGPLWGVSLALCLVGCGEADVVQTDPALERLNTWRAEQEQQECPDVPQDEAAKALVRDGQQRTRKVKIFGPPNPSIRRDEFLQHLWSRPNPLGAGILVTASRDGAYQSADRSRRRAGWLVLHSTVFPLNVDAARALGVLQDILPGAVLKEAGLPLGSFTLKSAFGIDDYALFRWHGEADPLPKCGGG